jgi:hypothetical protein
MVWAAAKDGAGNVFITGTFRGTATIGGNTLTATGASDIFVAKWNSSAGNFAWVQQVGGPASNASVATAIVVGNGGIYIAGHITDSFATFGNTTLVNNSYGWAISGVGSGRYTEGFVAKLTDAGSAGQFTWVKRIGGLYNEHINALAVVGTSVYVGGDFYSQALLLDGQTTLANTAVGSAGTTGNLFVAKLTDAGSTATFEWAQGAGPQLNSTTHANYIKSLAVVGGSIYAVGHCSTNVAFGNSAIALSGATQGGLVAKLTDAGSTGSFVWARRVGQGEYDDCTQVAASGNSVYVLGEFSSAQLTLDNATLTNTATATTDLFITKLTDAGATGNFIWGQQMGGTSWDNGQALAVQGNDVYVAGDFAGSVTIGGNTLVSNGYSDALVVRLRDMGTTASIQWAQQAGGAGPDGAYALVLVGTTMHVVGRVTPPATFGSLTLANSATFLATLAAVPLANVGPAAAQPSFEVFPNPARTVATVRVPAGNNAATLTLTDALGRVVRTQSATAGQDYPYDLAGLAPGVYALRMQAGAAVATQRLVVE